MLSSEAKASFLYAIIASEASFLVCSMARIFAIYYIPVNKQYPEIKKEYRDCIKRKWRLDWDMNETL